jgi:hypothetical protein
MFKQLRSKLADILAAVMAMPSLARESKGPEVTHHHLPGLRVKRYQTPRPRKGRARAGHEIEIFYDSKLGKRFAEAGSRGPRGY